METSYLWVKRMEWDGTKGGLSFLPHAPHRIRSRSDLNRLLMWAGRPACSVQLSF